MKYQFLIQLVGSGPNVRAAYQDMRRKLLPLRGWTDSDTVTFEPEGGGEVVVPEEEVQEARSAFKFSKDGLRFCKMGDTCRHDVVVYGIPACMMDEKETKKMIKRGMRMERQGKGAVAKNS